MRGCTSCFRLSNPDEIQQASRSRQIDKAIERERKERSKQIRVLLLGAGESGKSTFLKQMRIIHGLGFDSGTIREFQHIIYMNIIQGMRVLIDARAKLNIQWEKQCNEMEGNALLQFKPGYCVDQWNFIKFVPSIIACWHDEGIQKAFQLRNLFQLPDCVQYFFNNIHRISSTDWTPSTADIMHLRRETKGIHELSININGVPFSFTDVGGQRSQRVKWLSCFDSITSVLFLVATSEFDQVLLEDRATNRLAESRTIFDTIVNNRTFTRVSIILFLNKIDLLMAKVASGVSISEYFPEFKEDDRDIDQVKLFILNSFISLKREPTVQLFSHWTSAIDTENIRLVFSAVKKTILQRNLEHLMLT